MGKEFNYAIAVKFLSTYTKKYRKHFAVFYCGWLLEMIISVILTGLIGLMIDEIVYYQNKLSFIKISLVILFTILFLCALYFFIYAQHQYLLGTFVKDIRVDILRHWHARKAESITDSSAGDVLASLQTYSIECLQFIIRNIVHFINGIIKLIALIIILFLTNWKIGLFIIIAAPFSLYVSIVFGKQNKIVGEKKAQLESSYTGWIYEVISIIKHIRIWGAKEKIQGQHAQKNKEIFSENIKIDTKQITSNNIINFICLLIKLVIFMLVAYLGVRNEATLGTLIVIVSYYSIFCEQVWWTSHSYIDSQRRIAYIKTISDFMQCPIEENVQAMLAVDDGDIEFKNVFFSYANSPVLFDDLSLCIKNGKKTAIVGRSGCGKTTLAYMLLAFYMPCQGEILINNLNIAQCSNASIRSCIGLISQDVLIFNASIRENIILGNEMATDEEIIFACRKAGLWEFIETLPLKLDTVIGANGQEISFGQKQRIAIARIYVKNPAVIIFDEATSALDEETEMVIHQAWKELLNDRTAIIIAHKLSSVLMSDYVAIVEDGKVISYGATEDIVKNDIKFKEIFVIEKNCNDVQKF